MDDDQHEAIAFLSNPASHGGGAVERITTHCSMVFLAGDRAFKLKRAVRFSYLDYSTLALREKFCRAELALNRRTAPDLYLGVRALTRRPEGGLAFDGDGPAVDWVLEMRRFDQATLFDRLADAGRLTPGLLRALADSIAAFHGAAEIVPERGGRAQIAATIAINNDNLRLAVPALDRRAIDALHAASLARLAAVADLLDARRTGGAVRRCHGDLHLRNICLFEDKPTLFDGIEFNDDFAAIDVLYDLAFLLMDLLHRGLDDGASLVLNRYLDWRGDSAGLTAMPLFLSARAAVRAHVLGALLRAESAAPDRSATTTTARSYLALAIDLLRPHAPRLVAVGGLSGTGKSTLAQALAPALLPAPGARVIRSDVVRKRLAGVAPETRLPPQSYSREAAHRVYAALQAETRTALAAGYCVIADATFLRPEERQAIAATARAAAVPFTGLWLEAPGDVLMTRVAARETDASDADRAVLARQLALETGAVGWRRVDASRGMAETIAAARQALSARERPEPSWS
jgi:aminoglycoside phosphotransferase family enzyme/predicted kinase